MRRLWLKFGMLDCRRAKPSQTACEKSAMKAVPHPIPYQGSKRNLAPAILRYFAKDINRLVEPFAGSAALSIAAAAQGLAQRFWLNDLNRPLVDLLKQIVEQPEALAAFYEQLWNQQQSD